MNANKRPISMTVLACMYLALGTVVFVFHFRELLSLQQDSVWVELTELLAIVSGAFMLRGNNWARWLALAWIVFHVILSAFHAWPEFAIHGLFSVLVAWILFRPEAALYFRSAKIKQS